MNKLRLFGRATATYEFGDNMYVDIPGMGLWMFNQTSPSPVPTKVEELPEGAVVVKTIPWAKMEIFMEMDFEVD